MELPITNTIEDEGYEHHLRLGYRDTEDCRLADGTGRAKYIVHHVVIKEQLPNAMQDGQIHDIPKVAQTIREVVAEISAYTSLQITEAVVAAAGRSLRTQRGQSTIRLPSIRRSPETCWDGWN